MTRSFDTDTKEVFSASISGKPIGTKPNSPSPLTEANFDKGSSSVCVFDLQQRTQELMENAGTWMAHESRLHLAETAKEWFFELTGRTNEDDSTFERRMAVYLEFLLFVWTLPGEPSKHPWELFVRESGFDFSSRDLQITKALDASHWSVFELLEKHTREVYLSDLLFGGQWRVRPEGAMLGVEEGDVFQARLFCINECVFFTQAFLHHPSEARHLVKKIIDQDISAGKSPLQTAGRLAHMHLKFDRYRRMNMLQIYTP